MTRRRFLESIGSIGTGLLLTSCSPNDGPAERPDTGTETDSIMYGVTLDRIDNLGASIDALRYLPGRITVRLVFDEYIDPPVYADAIDRLHPVADIMGQILDSSSLNLYSIEEYGERAEKYATAFTDKVAIWEVGNEVNGEWLLNEGEPRAVVADKIAAAYNAVKTQGGETALTLYYNKECQERAGHEIFRWTDEILPGYVRDGLDHVYVSYYEEDCNGKLPDWQAVFERLREQFPKSKLGFGEVGASDPNEQAEYLRRYYSIHPDVEGFIGGYFWWHFYSDMVEPFKQGDKQLLDALAEVVKDNQQ